MTATPPPARSLREICADAQRANCGHCWTAPGDECVYTTAPVSVPVTPGTPVSPVRRYHVARFGRAERHRLITAAELESATAGLPPAAVIWDNGNPPRLPDAGNGPRETERQVRELPAVRAVYDAFGRDPGPGKMTPHCRRILNEACTAASVDLGAYDDRILTWLAGWGPETCAVIAALLSRALAAGRARPPGSVLLTAAEAATARQALADASAWRAEGAGCEARRRLDPESACEADRPGRGMGHVTLWCGTCSAEDHRDTRFYEPPHQVGHNRPLSGWVTRPDALALRTRRPGRRPRPRTGLPSGP